MMATRPGAARSAGIARASFGPRRARRRAHQRADRGEHAREHFAIVELGELGKARTLGDDQPDDVLAAGREHLAHEQIDDLPDDHPHRHVGLSVSRACRRTGSASSGPAPGTAPPCRGNRDRSCPSRPRRAHVVEPRAAKPRPRTRPAPRRGSLRAARRARLARVPERAPSPAPDTGFGEGLSRGSGRRAAHAQSIITDWSVII